MKFYHSSRLGKEVSPKLHHRIPHHTPMQSYSSLALWCSYFDAKIISVLARENKAPILVLRFTAFPGAPLTYFNAGGVRRIFWGLTFWPKGIFLDLWKTPGLFWVAKTTQGFFWVLYFSSAQINNNISAIYCLSGITGYFWDCNLFEK